MGKLVRALIDCTRQQLFRDGACQVESLVLLPDAVIKEPNGHSPAGSICLLTTP